MALHTKKQFAQMCGMPTGRLSEYQSRGKVVYSGDYVDDTIQVNIDFFQKWSAKKKSGPESESEIPKEVASNVKTEYFAQTLQIAEPIPQKQKLGKINKPEQGYESRSDQLKNKNLEIKNRLLEQKIEKILGETIPFDLVTQAGASAFRNGFIQVRDAMEKRLTRWTSKFTTQELADERKATLENLNEAIRIAIAEYKKSIAEIVAVNSNKKDIGEHE